MVTKSLRTVTIVIDGREHEMPLAFRAVHILATAGLDGTYRIFEDRDGRLLQLHPVELVLSSPGDEFVCVPHASGPGGGDDRRIRMINAAIATDDGDAEAWDRYEEWERHDV